MARALGALLRAGLAVKLGHVRQATSSYIRDRGEQTRSTVSGYVIAAAFYAAAGIFMIAALLVGAAALFRWVEMNYGTFMAFGATAAALVVLTALCALIAASSMRPPRKTYPSLGSRLRVAMRAAPAAKTATAKSNTAAAPPSRQPTTARDNIASARNTATAVLRAPARLPSAADSAATSPVMRRASVAAAVGLIGWALARRYGQAAAPLPAKRVRT